MSMKSRLSAAFHCNDSKKYKDYVAKKAADRAALPDDPSYAPWLKMYQAHLKAVKNAKPYVDSSEPITFNHRFLCIGPYNKRLEAFKRLEEENAVFLKRIATIYSVPGGRIDNRFTYNRHGPNPGIVQRNRILRLMFENIILHESIKNVRPTMSRWEQLRWYAFQEELMAKRSWYPLHFKTPPCTPFESNILQNASRNPIRQGYFVAQTGSIQEQCNIAVELFAKQCPFTVANFEKLLEAKKECRTSYRCQKFEKLVCVAKRGSGEGPGEAQYWRVAPSASVFSQFAKYMVGEDSKFKHETAWLLTKPKQIATGEFYITVAPALYLDKLCTVFGRIGGDGQRFLEDMQKTNVDKLGYPINPIFITACGLGSSNQTSISTYANQ